jgi:hypothetical protein
MKICQVDEPSRRPIAVRTLDINGETARGKISTDRQTILPMMEKEAEIIRETTRKVLVEGLGKRDICCRFVTHSLKDEQKAHRLRVICGCRSFLVDPTVNGRRDPGIPV